MEFKPICLNKLEEDYKKHLLEERIEIASKLSYDMWGDQIQFYVCESRPAYERKRDNLIWHVKLHNLIELSDEMFELEVIRYFQLLMDEYVWDLSQIVRKYGRETEVLSA